MIISIQNKSSGFFSQFFFVLNHYLYAKKNNLQFSLNTKNWLFKYKSGWNDYFCELATDFHKNNCADKIFGHCNVIENYKIVDYIEAINDIYKLNDYVSNKKNEIIEKFNLKKYCGIFIRRGDKLVDESEYIPSVKYLEKLLQKVDNCTDIFIQTDDYNSYIDIKKYIDENKLNINAYTLCDEDVHGMVIFNYYKQKILNDNSLKYAEIFKDEQIRNFKPIEYYNNEEIFEHTLKMLIGIEILRNSDICVLDYQSNVSRFIKLAHKNVDNVYDVSDNVIDMNKNICPAYSF